LKRLQQATAAVLKAQQPAPPAFGVPVPNEKANGYSIWCWHWHWKIRLR